MELPAMMRITRIKSRASKPTFKLEGKLVGPWVEEMHRAVNEASAICSQPRLDLSDVTFVDASGVTLLRELIRRGVAITACSGFVAAMLHEEES